MGRQESANNFVSAVLKGRFLAAHWRRGDRGFAVEMGVGGMSQMAISRPKFFAQVGMAGGAADATKFVLKKANELGLQDVLLLTNSGSKDDLGLVRRAGTAARC